MADIVKSGGELAKVSPSVLDIVASAVQSGRPANELTELLAFAREMQADQARQAFAHAMAEFKRRCPKIVRRTENSQFKVTRMGVTKAKTYASLSDIGAAIDTVLGDVGLSYDWTDAEVVGGSACHCELTRRVGAGLAKGRTWNQ